MSEKLEDKMEALDLTTLKAAEEGAKEDFVDPWNVVGGSEKGIDYDKLISKKKIFVVLDQILTICILKRDLDHPALIQP